VGAPNGIEAAPQVLGGALLDQIQLRSDTSQNPRQSRSKGIREERQLRGKLLEPRHTVMHSHGGG